MKVLPLGVAPEIVRHEKPTVEQILPENRHLLVVEREAAGFNHVNPRVTAEVFVLQPQKATVGTHPHRRDLLESIGKVKVAVRKVRMPESAFAIGRAIVNDPA